LVFGDVGDVIEDQQMEFVELGNSGFESELAATVGLYRELRDRPLPSGPAYDNAIKIGQ